MRRGMLILVMVAAGGRLPAQAPALPVVNAGAPRGFTLGSMIGFANGGAGTGLGVSGLLGFRRFAIGGFVSQVTGSELDKYQAAGGSVTAKILGGPLVPVSVNLQVGVGYYRNHSPDEQAKNWHIPVGLGIAWTIPRPVVAIKPWIAPRLDHTRVTPGDLQSEAPRGSATETHTDFGLSGGISFGLINGLGIDLAVDRVFASGVSPKPTVFGIGLHYTVR